MSKWNHYDRFDTEEPTRPGLHSEPVKRLRGKTSDTSDPWETVGNLLVEMAMVHKRLNEWTETANSLNARLGRIEKLLYGSGGTAALMLIEYLARRFGLHLIP